MTEFVRIDGLKELNDALNSLSKDLRERSRKRAVAAAAKIVRDDARERVPILKKPDPRRKPGTLRRAIRAGWVKQVSNSVYDQFNVFVKRLSKGAIRKFKVSSGLHSRSNPDDPFYWTVLEFGNGVNNSRPFLRPAFDAKRGAAIVVMAASLKKSIETAARRAKKYKGPGSR